MNPASILLPLDTRMGSLHLQALSDQSLMEIFIEGLEAESKARFQHADGTYKDICMWIGIKCDKKLHVKEIHWEVELRGAPWTGLLDFSLLPLSLQEFTFKRDPRKNRCYNHKDILAYAQRAGITGTIETSTLPLDLRIFEIVCHSLSGTVDFRRLPYQMTIFRIKVNKFYGRALLTSLPQSIEELDFCHNQFSGSLCLEFLPNSLSYLNASANRLSGSLGLDNLPIAMTEVYLDHNSFTGSLRFLRPPSKLKRLSVKNTFLRGTAVIARETYDKVDKMPGAFSHLVDENGIYFPNITHYEW